MDVLLVHLALATSILSQIYFTQESELCSELICWTLLAIGIEYTKPNGQSRDLPGGIEKERTSDGFRRRIWAIPVCLVVSSVCRSEGGLNLLSCILTPSILVVCRVWLPSSNPSDPDRTWYSNQFLGLALFSGLLGLIILPQDENAAIALSCVAFVAQAVFYSSMLHMEILASETSFFTCVRDTFQYSVARSTAMGVLSVIGIRTLLIGWTTVRIVPIVVLGVVKGISWWSIARTGKSASWYMAPVTQSLAFFTTCDLFQQSTLMSAAVPAIGGLLALSQILYLVPMQTKHRHTLWAFSLVFALSYGDHFWAMRAANTDSKYTYGRFEDHPVGKLIEDAMMRHGAFVNAQSPSLYTAEAEYRRRYAHDPPPGYSAWFSHAQSHGSPIIDDFDTIGHSLAPFRTLSGSQLSIVMDEAFAEPQSDLWLCNFESTTGKTDCQHRWREFDRHITVLLNRLLGDLKGVLPDVRFLVNHLDEPRVLFGEPGREGMPHSFSLEDISHQHTWDTLTKSCAKTNNTSNSASNQATTFGLAFVIFPASGRDMCRHPEYRDAHALFQSPTSLSLFTGRVPVLSTGAPSTMGDILIPSPAYIEDEFRYDETKDVPWSEKTNNVYWRGSTTGGFAWNAEWRRFHRQRFVSLAQGLGLRQYAYLRKMDGVLRRVNSSFLNRRLYDVAFTRIFQCEPKYCWDQKAFFRTKSWANKNHALHSRLAFDLDGNGISGRFYQLLASRSLPLKQTLLREWHDDRLRPWIHYIPVSQTMEELPELVEYFTSNEHGQRQAEEIAERGREWFSRAFRDVDMTIYMYRLLLELARLQDFSREAEV